MTSPLRPRLATSALALLLALASGCSLFRPTKRVDMQPFAENTVTAIGEMRKIQTPPVWIRLRPYINHPSILEVRKTSAPLFLLVRGVNLYSLQVVSLNDSPISERTKVRELAKFLHGASQQALLNQADEAEIALTPERRETILKDIGSKETFREALEAAEPIVNAVLARGLDLSDALDASILAAGAVIEREIQAQYAAMLVNRAALVALQEKNMAAQAWAEALEFGDEAAADRIRQSVPVLAELLPAGKRPGPKEQAAVVAALGAQALRIKTALDQIDPQYVAYRESIYELDTLRAKAVENAKLARSVLMVWARSHKNLGRGVEVPAMFDVARIITDTAKAEAEKGIPLPL
jgi:hypothetical protein